MLCAFISVVFCMMLHNFERLYRYVFKNPYLRAFAGGCFVLLVTACIGNYNYNGTGMDIIASSIHGSTDTWAFFFKMVLTAFTLGAGFKGGEIVPSFFVGATFGCLVRKSDRFCAIALRGSRHECCLLRCHQRTDFLPAHQF